MTRGEKTILTSNFWVSLMPCLSSGTESYSQVVSEYRRALASGRRFSGERGWIGLEMELNEDANASLCYT